MATLTGSVSQIVISALSIFAIYSMSYFWSRTRLSKQVRLKRTAFVLNLLALLLLVFVFQVGLLKRLDMYSTFLVITTIVMGVGSVLHHMSLIFRHKAAKHKSIERIHGPISHLMVYIPLGINMELIGTALLKDAQNFGDVLWSTIFLVIMAGISIWGVLLGLNKLQLPYP
jgi:hypothetical protein